MTRYLVGAPREVIAILTHQLPNISNQFTVLSSEAGSSGLPRNHMVVDTSPEGAEQLRTMLDGIGDIEIDQQITPPNFPF